MEDHSNMLNVRMILTAVIQIQATISHIAD